MENMNKGVDKRDNLINELLQGIGFAKELRNHFMNPINPNPLSSLSNDDLASNYMLLEKLLSIFDKTISMAKLLHIHQDHPSINLDNNYSQVGSPHSLTMSSPTSENSHPNFPPSKRRKLMVPKWSKTVRISNGGVTAGLEGSLNDGFSWRKYGQKAILDAKFPRCYYRCTHRHNQGCRATKHVQRSDEDPTIYQIMYIGEHTCTQGTQSKPNIPAQINSNPQPPPSPQQEVYVGLSPDGDIKIEPEQELDDSTQIFRSFSFNQAHQVEPIYDNYILGFYPTFSGLAVETSEVNINNGGSGLNTDANSPVMGSGDFEFSVSELLEFGDNISFDFGLLS